MDGGDKFQPGLGPKGWAVTISLLGALAALPFGKGGGAEMFFALGFPALLFLMLLSPFPLSWGAAIPLAFIGPAMIVLGMPSMDSPPTSQPKQRAIPSLTTTHEQRELGEPCAQQRFGNWLSRCSFVLTTGDLPVMGSAQVAKAVITYDSHEIRFSVGVEAGFEHAFRTFELPTVAFLKGIRYVPAVGFVSERDTSLQIGDLQVPLVWDGLPQWHVPQDFEERALEAMRNGTTANISVYLLESLTASIPLNGAADALNSVHPGHTSRVADPDPVSLFAKLIVENAAGIDGTQLDSVRNPLGEGYFVYLPLQTFSGGAIWFVHGSRVVSLSGSARQFTPSVPFPNDVGSVDLWRDTGLSAPNAPTPGPDATIVGREAAFGSSSY